MRHRGSGLKVANVYWSATTKCSRLRNSHPLTNERKSIRISVVMRTSVATEVAGFVARRPTGSFIHARDLVKRIGSRAGVDVALSRLANGDPSLTRVRHGLYWKSPVSRFGTAKPRPFDVAVAAADAEREGVGPAGWTALHLLGLTTQVPTIDEVAVLGAAPSRVSGTVYRSRSNPERAALRFYEIAALEALRLAPPPNSAEWSAVVEKLRGLSKDGSIRWKKLCDAAEKEPPRVRETIAHVDEAIALAA
jgi:hypothetical protein